MNQIINQSFQANINPTTQIPFGYVSANELDGDVVDSIMQAQTKNISLANFMQENLSESDFKDWENRITTDEVDEIEEQYMALDVEDEIYEAEYGGVKLLSSWLGGALHFFVLESTHITDVARKASPCVPNAGILSKDMDGSVRSYSIPDDWWSEYA